MPTSRRPPSPSEPLLPEPVEPLSQIKRLSIPRTRLIGREQDCQAVQQWLRQDDVRLLTLTGLGGIGKTRIAVQVAMELDGTFTDGAVMISLAHIREPDL